MQGSCALKTPFIALTSKAGTQYGRACSDVGLTWMSRSAPLDPCLFEPPPAVPRGARLVQLLPGRRSASSAPRPPLPRQRLPLPPLPPEGPTWQQLLLSGHLQSLCCSTVPACCDNVVVTVNLQERGQRQIVIAQDVCKVPGYRHIARLEYSQQHQSSRLEHSQQHQSCHKTIYEPCKHLLCIDLSDLRGFWISSLLLTK